MLYTINAFLGKGNPMGKAKVCDRCGKVYSVKQHDHKYRRSIKIRYGYDYGKDTDYIEQDLCLDCGIKFENFMAMQEPLKITRIDNTDHNEEEN